IVERSKELLQLFEKIARVLPRQARVLVPARHVEQVAAQQGAIRLFLKALEQVLAGIGKLPAAQSFEQLGEIVVLVGAEQELLENDVEIALERDRVVARLL